MIVVEQLRFSVGRPARRRSPLPLGPVGGYIQRSADVPSDEQSVGAIQRSADVPSSRPRDEPSAGMSSRYSGAALDEPCPTSPKSPPKDGEQAYTDAGAFALQGISLEVPRGEYFVLLGPSGAGKTLFLECLCGLHRLDAGRILVQGADVTRLEPRRRRIGYLPQDYALFPHLSVRTNVAFGLCHPLAAWWGAERGPIDELLRLVDLEPLARRAPRNLSGGEKQRVALARALAARPLVLLLDEPVSALDEQMRDTLCRQIKHLQRRTGTTTIHVCHNFAEMLAVADRVGVIHRGRIVQVGTPQEVLQRPRNRFVAQFVQAGNVLTGQATSDGPRLRIACPDGLEFRVARAPADGAGRQVAFVVRPENVAVSRADAPTVPPDATCWRSVVREVSDLGALARITATAANGLTVQALLSRKEFVRLALRCGDPVTLSVAPEDVHVLDDG